MSNKQAIKIIPLFEPRATLSENLVTEKRLPQDIALAQTKRSIYEQEKKRP